eukprot:TRINITY_DN6269_c0_g1_i1.p1 TRINITY_DN6269_c0_g1~~TRINITY_DN6269_c0_g1_i1.p1  ORF type:complete len:421 (+),score=91.01 TRINITY_DN6269_c0_g1_i1:107-1369(+)
MMRLRQLDGEGWYYRLRRVARRRNTTKRMVPDVYDPQNDHLTLVDLKLNKSDSPIIYVEQSKSDPTLESDFSPVPDGQALIQLRLFDREKGKPITLCDAQFSRNMTIGELKLWLHRNFGCLSSIDVIDQMHIFEEEAVDTINSFPDRRSNLRDAGIITGDILYAEVAHHEKDCMIKEYFKRLTKQEVLVDKSIWKSKKRSENANKLKEMQIRITELKKNTQEHDKKIATLQKKRKGIDEAIKEQKSQLEVATTELKAHQFLSTHLELELEQMEGAWINNEKMVKNGINNCNPEELWELLRSEGVQESTISILESNRVGGALFSSLTSEWTKNDLEISLPDRLKLAQMIRSWNRREMVEEDEKWNSTSVVEWSKQFEFIDPQIIKKIQVLQIDGPHFLGLESSDLKELGTNTFAERKQIME